MSPNHGLKQLVDDGSGHFLQARLGGIFLGGAQDTKLQAWNTMEPSNAHRQKGKSMKKNENKIKSSNFPK